MKIILTDNELELHNVTLLKEFNDKEFSLEIESIPYLIKGVNLVLNNVYDNNQTIKITGKINSIEILKNKDNNEKKGFIKRLLQ